MPKPWNILLFAVDSLRADHMSCYGYDRFTTPYADQLAAEGVLFENLYSAYIPTTPAYTTLFTGMDVKQLPPDVFSRVREILATPEMQSGIAESDVQELAGEILKVREEANPNRVSAGPPTPFTARTITLKDDNAPAPAVRGDSSCSSGTAPIAVRMASNSSDCMIGLRR